MSFQLRETSDFSARKEVVKKTDLVAITAHYTLTAAQCLSNRLIANDTDGSYNATLPTAALLVAAIPNAAVGDHFEIGYANVGAGGTLTITAGAGGTVTGTAVCVVNSFSVLRFIVDNVTAGAESYICTVGGL